MPYIIPCSTVFGVEILSLVHESLPEVNTWFSIQDVITDSDKGGTMLTLGSIIVYYTDDPHP